MSDYWERRKAQQMFEYMAGAEERAGSIAKLYLQASQYFAGKMDTIFERYQKQNGLSEADARRLLNQIRTPGYIDELKQLLRQATEDGNSEKRKQLLGELEAPAYRARLERLQRMYGNLDKVMQSIYKQEQIEHEAWYLELAADAYYHFVYDLQKQTGLAYSFGYISPKMIERVINSRWSGANYSERIWGNTQKLADDLKQELLLSLVTGRTDREAAEVFVQRFAVGASYARRLIRTESCYLCTQMDMLSYEDAEIEYYRYLATLDLRTSKICRELDGKVFRVADQQTGVNAPPMHPWCRSTTTAALNDEDLARLTRRAIDPATGKEIHVPAGMTYDQWYQTYVVGNPDAELNEKKIRNRYSDRKQLERYRAIIGDDIPKTLDDFQNLKYNEPEKWKELKSLKAYLKNNLGNTRQDYAVQTALKEAGIKGVAKVNPEKLDVSGYTYDTDHINAERAHMVSREEAERFINESDVSLTRWNGRFVNYYGKDGATYVDVENKNIRTSFSSREFDGNTLKIREVVEKYAGKNSHVPNPEKAD